MEVCVMIGVLGSSAFGQQASGKESTQEDEEIIENFEFLELMEMFQEDTEAYSFETVVEQSDQGESDGQ
jgi:hypothetical protein